MLTTTRFVDLTARVAANFGMPDTRVVVVDHPLGGTDEATIVRWADAAVEQAVACFTGQVARGLPDGSRAGGSERETRG